MTAGAAEIVEVGRSDTMGVYVATKMDVSGSTEVCGIVLAVIAFAVSAGVVDVGMGVSLAIFDAASAPSAPVPSSVPVVPEVLFRRSNFAQEIEFDLRLPPTLSTSLSTASTALRRNTLLILMLTNYCKRN